MESRSKNGRRPAPYRGPVATPDRGKQKVSKRTCRALQNFWKSAWWDPQITCFPSIIYSLCIFLRNLNSQLPTVFSSQKIILCIRRGQCKYQCEKSEHCFSLVLKHSKLLLQFVYRFHQPSCIFVDLCAGNFFNEYQWLKFHRMVKKF